MVTTLRDGRRRIGQSACGAVVFAGGGLSSLAFIPERFVAWAFAVILVLLALGSAVAVGVYTEEVITRWPVQTRPGR